ncbi:hypothetical protein DFQ28_010613 [Apophysomyces sp. BC1034]|nr:hypothetical protein DFQ30_010268 [Apophysomyces sp. BC1015]KAG0181497.1 hypothetical protein DFQ29_008166 [Apophysomyces sp. BC1021]KAG0191922.1 hypothetical protein DFQ28_010613 [Apophysomyces sp. BC1034]
MAVDWPLLRFLSNKNVVLASASPRRREILTDMGIVFEVVTTLKPDENDPFAYATPGEYVKDTARMKAKEVLARCQADRSLPDADIVIGADTVVVIDGHVLEKPRDYDHAVTMLQKLSGRTHEVLTGVCVLGPCERTFVETTRVTFSEIDADTIKAYVASREPFDKAGAYGIQGEASLFVQSIEGDYWNVASIQSWAA